MVDFGKSLSFAFRFSLEPKRWLPFFALDAVTLTAVMYYIFANIYALAEAISMAQYGGFPLVASILSMVAVGVLVFIAWALVRLYLTGAIIHQSYKPKEFRQSWTVAKERFFSMLAVGVIVGLCTTMVGFVPYIGWLFSIFISMIFYFSMQAVFVKRLGFMDALRDSYHLFTERFTEVFVTWLVIVAISIVIMILFILPAGVIIFSNLMPVLGTLSETASATEVMMAIMSAGWGLLPGAIIFLIGSSIVNVFSTCAKTKIYQQMKSNKLGVL